ncbi:uncharacterized protein LOC114335522 [Diabrotica virgifera virgifera]|uniref:Uncharacterized protein LOC114335522 n=1 Tax=Diabrotica virgifera virgifera TaxID=50390 RepID=A0A6P7FYC2_DIAVI|nr:uncharacterized protein LOC114335522 [Diabrotica virgifera virgifera]
MIADYIHIKKSKEVIAIILIAIWFLSADNTHNELNSNLEEIWKFKFSKEIQKNKIEHILKYILSFIVMIRTLTSRIFLVLYVIILWPAVFETQSFLIIPWLIIGSVRILLSTFLSLSTGTYCCLLQKGLHLLCLNFVISQFSEHGPSIYAWFAILKYYRHITREKLRRRMEILLAEKDFQSNIPTTDTMSSFKSSQTNTRSLDTLSTVIVKSKDTKKVIGSIRERVKTALNLTDEEINKITERTN